MPETEIAPTREAMSQVDRPLAVVNGVGTTGVAVWNVSVDHLNRPVLMTNATKVAMWTAVWQPWGGAHSITGTATLDTRFPGQWYQSETGLHYNWHRSYDPTVGRYTQPDPLGFVDGPSVYGYAGGRPQSLTDFLGLYTEVDIWNPVGIGSSSFGHVSVDINGKNYSFGTGGWDTKYPNADDYRGVQGAFRGGDGYPINLTPIEEVDLKKCLDDLVRKSKGNNPWRPFGNNCTAPIQSCLRKIKVCETGDTGTIWPSKLGVQLGKCTTVGDKIPYTPWPMP
jgi:RHS repeat-associated protein